MVPSAISITAYSPAGKAMKATPDGRCDHDILADICKQATDRQRLVFEIMDPHRVGSAREHVEHLVPAVAVGRRVILGIGLLMDEHHGHTFDGTVFIDNAAAERGRRYLRRRRDGQKQEEKV